jgi:hypothetical protein
LNDEIRFGHPVIWLFEGLSMGDSVVYIRVKLKAASSFCVKQIMSGGVKKHLLSERSEFKCFSRNEMICSRKDVALNFCFFCFKTKEKYSSL